MKELSIFIFVLLMFVPPVQAHADAVIFTDILDSHPEVINNDHEEEHHQNDSDDNKNTEHHHHCTSLGFSSALISPLATYSNLVGVIQEKKSIHFYNKMNSSSIIDIPEEPPRI